jgi:hypothetical protein
MVPSDNQNSSDMCCPLGLWRFSVPASKPEARIGAEFPVAEDLSHFRVRSIHQRVDCWYEVYDQRYVEYKLIQ